MGRHRTITLDDATKKAAEMYRNGATVKEAAEAVYLSPEGLRYRFWILGIVMRGTRRGKQLPPELIEKIRQERLAGKSYKQIRCDYKISNRTIRKYTQDITPDFEVRGARRTISFDDDTKKAVALYQNGATSREAAAAVHLSRGGLQHRFKVLGIPMREPGKKRLTEEQVKQIRREYQGGKSFCRIAKEMGISTTTVRKYAK